MGFNQSKSERTVQILAVDDLPDNLDLINAILDGEGYQVHCVRSGEAALESIAKHPPDLILMDVMMPGMDGYEVTCRVRQDSSLPYIPILLITADDRSNVVKGLDAGADDFIRKPVDIDELLARVRSMLRLKHSVDDLQAILRQRDDFVARLTHDLRTPLVAANRILQFCLDGAFGGVGDELQTVLSNMLSNNQNLLSMTNTLLEVYRHEAGQKNLSVAEVNLVDLVEKVVEELMPLARAKDLQLRLATAPSEHPEQYQVSGDALELRRVLTNLIGNAIKFTDYGSVTLRCSLTDTPADDEGPSKLPAVAQWVQLSVTDTGCGITARDRPHLFSWYRPGKHRNSSSGLGLHLSQRIAKMHGGRLSVRSQPGEGSTFTLTLPATTASIRDEDEEADPRSAVAAQSVQTR